MQCATKHQSFQEKEGPGQDTVKINPKANTKPREGGSIALKTVTITGGSVDVLLLNIYFYEYLCLFRRTKGRSKKNYQSDESDDNRRNKKNGKDGKKIKSKYNRKESSEESDDDEAVAAYYAVRIDKSKGMTVTQQAGSENGRYDSSSESTSTAPNQMKRPNIDAPAPAKGILKKAVSNTSLAKLDGMSEISGAISEVGYITNKLTQRLKARGQRDILDPIDIKQRMESRMESSSDDIWNQERDNWTRQKEELKAWALSQGNESSSKVEKKFLFVLK